MWEHLWVRARMWAFGTASGLRDGRSEDVSFWTVQFGAWHRKWVVGGSFGWWRGCCFDGRGYGECGTQCLGHGAFPVSGLRGCCFGGRGCGEYVTPCLGHAVFPASGLCEKSFDGRGCGACWTPSSGHAACLATTPVALALNAVACPDPLTGLLCLVVTSFSGAF
jgi:hypothetical protein